MRALIAEDDRVTRRVLEATLTKWGYEVLPCADGAQAWEVLQGEDSPELVLLDWMMPVMDGLEVCRKVRQSPDLGSTYIILLTAKGREVIEGLLAGADDCVSKPFDTEELRVRVSVGERVVNMQSERLRRETESYVQRLERTAAELHASRRRIVEVQEEARKAIAEQLHGSVQTRMYLLAAKLEEIKEAIASNPEQAQGAVALAAAELESIREDEIRQISHSLHPSIIGVGLGAGLRSLRDTYERGVPIRLEIADEVAKLEPTEGSTIPFNVRLGLYRVANEALGNVLKHAEATLCMLTLCVEEANGQFVLAVEDNGKGFDAHDGRRGLGMATMRDYMGAMGGSLRLDSSPGRGTRVAAIVPTKPDSDRDRPSSPSEDYLAVLAGQRQWIATTNFAGCPGRPQIALRIAPCSLPRQSS